MASNGRRAGGFLPPRVVEQAGGVAAVTAAATRVQRGNPASLAALRRRERWQDECWATFDTLGEVKQSTNLQANVLARLRLFVAWVPDDADDHPVPIVPEVPEGADPDDREFRVVPRPVFDACNAALDRIADPTGGHTELLRRLVLNLQVAGELWLHGRQIKPDTAPGNRTAALAERWEVYSTSQVREQAGEVKVQHAPDVAGVTIDPAEEVFVRIHSEHPRWPELADSPLRGVLGPAEILLLLEQWTRAVARSRLSAGILKVPTEASLSMGGRHVPAGSGPEEFLELLMDAMLTPIEDEGDPSTVTPIVMQAQAEALKAVEWLFPDRKLDQRATEIEKQALQRLAQGLNLPVERVTGIGDLNHWNAWEIKDATFRDHLEPLAVKLVYALTGAVLQPSLEAGRVPDAGSYVVWYDPSRLLSTIDPEEHADEAHDRFVISDAAYRRLRGFSEKDVPDDDEMRARVARNAARRSSVVADSLTEGTDPVTGEQDDTPQDDDDGDDDGDPAPAATVAAMVASSRTPADLGARLRDLDRDLRVRVEAAADAQLRRALERAGSRLRSKARSNRQLTDTIASVPNDRVAQTLGPAIVAQLGVESIELMAGEFDPLEARFLGWCTYATERAVGMIPDLPDERHAALTEAYDNRAGRAWSFLRARLEEIGADALYQLGTVPDRGEWDDATLLPFGVVRQAVALAGGADEVENVVAAAPFASVSSTALGIATGLLMSRAYSDAGVSTEAWSWDYGPYRRSRSFDPHRELDGYVFSSFTDEVLANHDSWPPEPFYSPGDHDGCRCDVTPVMVDQASGAAVPEVDVYGPGFDPGSLDVGLLVAPDGAPAAALRRHPAGGYTAVDEAGEGFYVRQLPTNEGRAGPWRIERQYRGSDGVLRAVRVGEAATLQEVRRWVGSQLA